MTLCNSNTLNAQSIIGTKDRIKEIKFVEDINIEKLIRNQKTKLASTTSNYIRTAQITARNLEITRNENKEDNNKKQEKEINKIQSKAKTKATKINVKKIKNNKKTEIKKTVKKETKKEIKLETNKTEQKSNSKKVGKISISRNMDLTKRTGLSKAEFKELVKHVSQDTSKFFYNNADTIYDLCARYQINEIFFCGLISAESGWNIAGNHRKTHNYISLMSGGKLIHYSSTKQGLEVAAQKLHNNYLTPGGKFYGGKTLAGVKKKFCPSGNWVNLVYGRMSQMVAAAKKIK